MSKRTAKHYKNMLKKFRIVLHVEGEQWADSKKDALAQFHDTLMIDNEGDIMSAAEVEEIQAKAL